MKNVWIRQTRRKAVWGPKRTLAALAVLCVVGLAGRPAEAKPQHGHQPGTKTPGAPGGFVKNYKLDDLLDDRANHGEGRLTTRVIVQLNPGATLPPEFRKFALNRKLDLVNGEVLDLPNSVLKRLAAHPSVFQIHYDRPIGAQPP